MGRIYCVMGKSASGKDSIYHEVMKQEPELLPIVPYSSGRNRGKRISFLR